MIRPESLIRSDSEMGTVMQAPATNIKEDEVDCGIANIPCCFGNRARCQQMATPGRFLVAMVFLALIVSTVEGYIYASAKLLSTTFSYPPSLFDWLLSAIGLFQGVSAVAVAYWGRRIHRPAWLGGLSCLLGAFCLVAIIPYVGPDLAHNNATTVSGPRLCERELSQLVDPEEDSNGAGIVMVNVLIVLLVFLSMVNVSFWSHGITYIDDNVESKKTPRYIGILVGLRITSVKNGYSVMSLVAGSPELWWVPFAVLGALLIIVGTIIVCFPQKLIGTIMRQTAASILDIASGNSSDTLAEFQPHSIKKEERFWPTLKRVITNKIIITNTLALSLFAMAIIHFGSYENFYLQAQYHIPYTDDFLDPWTSRALGDMFKMPMIILVVMVAGLTFSRFRPSAKKVASFNVVMAVHTVMIFLAFIFLDCKTSGIVGEEGSRYFTPLCSHDCRCRSSEVVFEPVCLVESSQTYFSPCHAGCTTSTHINNMIVYGNCTCGPNREHLVGTGPLSSATRGACSADDCFQHWTLFQVFYVVNIAIAAATLVAHLLLTLRCVRAADKATAVGFVLSGVGLISYMPGQLLYKFISDSTCRYWNADGYSCNLHSTSFADLLAGVTAAIVLVSALLSAVVLRMCRNLQIYDEPEKLDDVRRSYPLEDTSQGGEQEEEPLRNNGNAEREVSMYRPVLRTTQI